MTPKPVPPQMWEEIYRVCRYAYEDTHFYLRGALIQVGDAPRLHRGRPDRRANTQRPARAETRWPQRKPPCLSPRPSSATRAPNARATGRSPSWRCSTPSASASPPCVEANPETFRSYVVGILAARELERRMFTP